MHSLKARQKEAFIQEIFRHESRPRRPDGKFERAVLVADPESIKILDGCLSTYDLQGEGIEKTELLKNHDKPQNKHAIYFLSPVNEPIISQNSAFVTSLLPAVPIFRIMKAIKCLPN